MEKTTIFVMFMIIFDVQCDKIEKLFSNCRISQPDFEECLKFTFNRLNPLFKYGLPEYGVAPFDPHRQQFVEQIRGDSRGLGGYRLILKDVSEHGWTQSWITHLKMDWANNTLIYSQDFPEKSLDGQYVFDSKILGKPLKASGSWNITLYKYSQTTMVRRLGGPGGRLKVRVFIDRLGDMDLNISDLFGGIKVIENVVGFFINNAWQPVFPLIKPLINDLVSTAFTDIFNDSFRYFPLEKIIKY